MGPCCPANIGLAYGSVAADLGALGAAGVTSVATVSYRDSTPPTLML
jgi:hypothetical protein